MTTTVDLAPLLHRVGAGALDWLDAHREQFRAGDPAVTPPDLVKSRFKQIGELGLVGRILIREGVAGSQQAVQIENLLDFVWREGLRGGTLLDWLQRDEPFSPIPMELYVPFRELGYRDPALEEHIRLVSRTTSWQVLEGPPNRRLGLSRFEARAGLTPGTSAEEAAAHTWLGHTPEPWSADSHMAYAVTHTVFHLTDWGRHPERLPAALGDYLRLWLPAWTDEWAAARHWDLLGELLVVDACLPVPALDPGVWQRYAAAQQPEGAMPARGAMPEGDTEEVFEAVHHPTIVALFASTMAVSRAMSALSPPGP
ncbi:DUF6895 family protein [Streptomyces sp. SCSIO ZS0520]|uniref:DUF6895 family protein n=1 Tax=Streptomyces sp. SCSIO ZS0520 TaxID=2892996 RepID=UPI0021DB69FC|nr:hypothetical protein [Streptomyces sp. SCSIO ZS0520]